MSSLALVLVVATLLVVWSCFTLSFASAAASQPRTKTYSLSDTISVSASITPPPTPTRSHTVNATPTVTVTATQTETANRTRTKSPSLVPPPCRVSFIASSTTFTDVPWSTVLGAPDALAGEAFPALEIRAVDLSFGGTTISAILTNGIFRPGTGPRSKFTIFAKSRLTYSALTTPLEAAASSDYDGNQRHGLKRQLATEAKHPLFSFPVGPLQAESIEILPIPDYRVSADEWIVVAFHDNATIPPGCASAQGPSGRVLVLHVTSLRFGLMYSATQLLSFLVLLFGTTSALARASFPTSHYAAVVAMMSEIRFAHEDGNPIGFGLSPTQLRIGTDKYSYVRGAILAALGVPLIIATLQGVAFTVLRARGLSVDEAMNAVIAPRLAAQAMVHLLPCMAYAAARNFGNLQAGQFVLTSVSAGVFVVGLVASFSPILSARGLFGARFVETSTKRSLARRYGISSTNSSPSRARADHSGVVDNGSQVVLADGLENTGEREDGASSNNGVDSDGAEREEDTSAAARTSVVGTLKSLVTGVRGSWKSVDACSMFVERYGAVFENYMPSCTSFMGIETAVFLLVGLLTVIDNYTAEIASIQFIVTTAMFALLFAMTLARSPMANRPSGVVQRIAQAGLVGASLALSVGALKPVLLAPAESVKQFCALAAAIALGVDVALGVWRPLHTFLRRYAAQRGEREGSANAASRDADGEGTAAILLLGVDSLPLAAGSNAAAVPHAAERDRSAVKLRDGFIEGSYHVSPNTHNTHNDGSRIDSLAGAAPREGNAAAMVAASGAGLRRVSRARSRRSSESSRTMYAAGDDGDEDDSSDDSDDRRPGLRTAVVTRARAFDVAQATARLASLAAGNEDGHDDANDPLRLLTPDNVATGAPAAAAAAAAAFLDEPPMEIRRGAGSSLAAPAFGPASRGGIRSGRDNDAGARLIEALIERGPAAEAAAAAARREVSEQRRREAERARDGSLRPLRAARGPAVNNNNDDDDDDDGASSGYDPETLLPDLNHPKHAHLWRRADAPPLVDGAPTGHRETGRQEDPPGAVGFDVLAANASANAADGGSAATTEVGVSDGDSELLGDGVRRTQHRQHEDQRQRQAEQMQSLAARLRPTRPTAQRAFFWSELAERAKAPVVRRGLSEADYQAL